MAAVSDIARLDAAIAQLAAHSEYEALKWLTLNLIGLVGLCCQRSGHAAGDIRLRTHGLPVVTVHATAVQQIIDAEERP